MRHFSCLDLNFSICKMRKWGMEEMGAFGWAWCALWAVQASQQSSEHIQDSPAELQDIMYFCSNDQKSQGEYFSTPAGASCFQLSPWVVNHTMEVTSHPPSKLPSTGLLGRQNCEIHCIKDLGISPLQRSLRITTELWWGVWYIKQIKALGA